jgi:hypothetical protein
MTKKLTTKQALEQLRDGKSLQQCVLTDVDSQRLPVQDALLLVEHGFVVSEGNIVYDDADIAYDPDFDDGEWNALSENLQEFLVKKGVNLSQEQSQRITVELEMEDGDVRYWLHQNTSKLKPLLEKLLTDLYYTDKMLR